MPSTLSECRTLRFCEDLAFREPHMYLLLDDLQGLRLGFDFFDFSELFDLCDLSDVYDLSDLLDNPARRLEAEPGRDAYGEFPLLPDLALLSLALVPQMQRRFSFAAVDFVDSLGLVFCVLARIL